MSWENSPDYGGRRATWRIYLIVGILIAAPTVTGLLWYAFGS